MNIVSVLGSIIMTVVMLIASSASAFYGLSIINSEFIFGAFFVSIHSILSIATGFYFHTKVCNPINNASRSDSLIIRTISKSGSGFNKIPYVCFLSAVLMSTLVVPKTLYLASIGNDIIIMIFSYAMIMLSVTTAYIGLKLLPIKCLHSKESVSQCYK